MVNHPFASCHRHTHMHIPTIQPKLLIHTHARTRKPRPHISTCKHPSADQAYGQMQPDTKPELGLSPRHAEADRSVCHTSSYHEAGLWFCANGEPSLFVEQRMNVARYRCTDADAVTRCNTSAKMSELLTAHC